MKRPTPTMYARAILAVAHNEDSAALADSVENFLRLIQKNGDWARRHKIVAACEKMWRQQNGHPQLIIESARPLTRLQTKQLMQAANVYDERDVESRVRPELTAGVRLTLGEDRQLDSSLFYMLKKIFAV